jgi:hypothetical protein
MLDVIIDLATSSGFGAIVGLVGSQLAKIEKRKRAIIDNAHERDMADLDMQRDAAESAQALQMADKQIEQSQAEAEIASEVSSGEAFTASQLMGNKPSGPSKMDQFRTAMRPLITIFLLFMVSVLTYKIQKLLGGLESLQVTELLKLYIHIINQLVFLTVTGVLWWFGSRDTDNAKR